MPSAVAARQDGPTRLPFTENGMEAQLDIWSPAKWARHPQRPKRADSYRWGVLRDGKWMTLPDRVQCGHPHVTSWARAAAVAASVGLDPLQAVKDWKRRHTDDRQATEGHCDG